MTPDPPWLRVALLESRASAWARGLGVWASNVLRLGHWRCTTYGTFLNDGHR
jgi:hypothetical protein